MGIDIVLSFARSKDYSGIVTNSKKVEQAESVSKEIRNLRNSCDSIATGGDVSKEDDCIKLVAETVKHFGRIDVLIK